MIWADAGEHWKSLLPVTLKRSINNAIPMLQE